MGDHVTDRLNPQTYRDAEPVALIVGPPDAQPPLDDPGIRWVPEPLVERLAAIGSAYDLHVLSLIVPAGPERTRTLNHSQAEALQAELAFVRSVVVDPALQGVVDAFTAAAAQCVAQPGQVLALGFP